MMLTIIQSIGATDDMNASSINPNTVVVDRSDAS
jgi:hypothetical protein